jgi:hypothetical protein
MIQTVGSACPTGVISIMSFFGEYGMGRRNVIEAKFPPRDHAVMCHMTQQEFEEIGRFADKADLSMSAWMRQSAKLMMAVQAGAAVIEVYGEPTGCMGGNPEDVDLRPFAEPEIKKSRRKPLMLEE